MTDQGAAGQGAASQTGTEVPAAGEDWGPFGKPLFDDPSARALSRIGVVDVGSNSVRLVVFDGAARSPAYFYNEKVLCGLGQGLATTGRLNPKGRERALAALRRFALLARSMDLGGLTVVATAAMREAEDGPEFRAQVLRETGLRMWVIDGTEEARLSAQGVLLGWPEAKGIVCDIGGSSMELAVVRDGRIGKRLTSPLGPFRLQQIQGGAKGRKKHIEKILTELREELGTDHCRLYLVGGSWRAIAKVDMARRDYPLSVLHEYRMSQKQARATIKMIAETDTQTLRQKAGVSSARIELVPLAAEVLKQLIGVFHPTEIDISSYGIREGLLYEQMPQRLRARDPLIEACRFAEVSSARMPGFGRKLYGFLEPLYRAAPRDRIRLVKAACLLHDTTWRAHPDYRAEVCFDNVTRANLGGLTHRERVFLGLALLHRYKNSRSGSRFEALFKLLDERELQEAEVLGKAMRFGAMLTSDDPTRVAALRWFPRKKLLELRLHEEGMGLMGEVAEARFASLVAALKVEAKITRLRTPRASHPAAPV